MSHWRETHRAVVFPWHCDHYGHMNMRFYVDHLDDSSFQVWPALGFPRSRIREEGVESVTARYTINYLKELEAGAMLVMTAAITLVGTKSLSHSHRLHNVETGDLCATMEAVEVCFDLETRRSAPMPERLRTFLQSVLVDHDPPTEQAAGSAVAPSTPSGVWHDTHRGVVFPWRCDHFGHMNARWYGHHFDDGAYHLCTMAGIKISDLAARGVALVTAQAEINYLHELAAGDLFVVHSGFSRLGSKSMVHIHQMVNIETGKLCATMEFVEVAFNMETRKSTIIPDDVRQAISANLVVP